MILPNLFIIGAPKAGTTSLTEYLKVHPDIFFPKYIKEPHYFISEFPEIKFKGSLDEYLNLFRNAKNEKIIGEASTRYLYSSSSAKEIYNFNPGAKILAIFRNPIEMVFSWHNQLLYMNEESNEDIIQALLLENNRRNGKDIPPNCQFRQGLYYSEIAKYFKQIKRYLQYFDSSQIKIILYDNFFTNIEKEYKDILEFIDVDSSIKPKFKAYNVASQYRFKSIINFVKKKKPDYVRQVTHKIFSHSTRYRINDFIRKMNTKRSNKSKKYVKAYSKYIIDKYQEDVDNLSEFLKKDLNKLWFDKYR